MRYLLSFVAFISIFTVKLSAQKGPGTITPTYETLNFADTAHYFEKIAEFGLVFGMGRCNGDIANDNAFSTQNNLSPMGGIFYRKHFSPYFAFRGNLLAGQLEDEDGFYATPDWRAKRHFSFQTFVTEASGRIEWDVLGKHRFRRGIDTTVYQLDQHTQYALVNGLKRSVSPYVFVGAGAMASSAKPVMHYTLNSGEQPVEIQKDMDQVKQLRITPSVMLGGGLNFDLSERLVLGAEISTHLPFTDYLDGISIAGNPDKQDWLWFGGITLGIRLHSEDRDRDGVSNRKDKCPDIPGSAATFGCPDIDHDGVADRLDDCPHKKGIRALAGCPIRDADEDGVPDVEDACPNVLGLTQFQGCPDTDGDGIEDRQDTCKTLPGIAQFHGCPDTDGDGIEDKFDACPTEKGPAEYYYGCPVRDTDEDGVEDRLDACLLVKGLAIFNGCPDTDNDGVEDKLDPCPRIPGPKENRGCPVVEKKDREKLELAVKAVKFETGKAVLKPESSKILTDIADILARYPYYNLGIEGHTDSQGKDETNLVLSEKRAQACADFLITKGIAKTRFLVKGFGKTKPIGDNKTAAGRTLNRRVEFELVLPE